MNKYLSSEEIEALENEIPLRRIGLADEVANTVNMLINNEYITGQVITVDGGWIN